MSAPIALSSILMQEKPATILGYRSAETRKRRRPVLIFWSIAGIAIAFICSGVWHFAPEALEWLVVKSYEPDVKRWGEESAANARAATETQPSSHGSTNEQSD